MSAINILVVEDSPDIREVLSRLLQAEGFSIIGAKDCASGYAQLLKAEPDLVLVDVMLPDYSGLQFIRWMRARVIEADTPVIAMTAFEPGYLLAATHLGADAVIHKPEGLDRLTETIKAVLAQRAHQAERAPARGTRDAARF